MPHDLLAPIPPPHRALAAAALADAFGPALLEGLDPVTSGASGALTYRLAAAGRSYLMRIETRRDALRNPHQYACMQAAAEAGVAPPLRHVDPEAGVAIMDFIAQRPLAEHPGGPGGLVRAAGELVARLQATPAFPALADFPDLIGRLLELTRSANLFAAGLLDPHAEAFARLRDAYPWNAAPAVSSHNDPNAQNVLFDGDRLWLVDWETACRNDPLVDVAILAENFAPTPELEAALLQAWRGRAPDPGLRARLTLMRRLVRLYYAGLIFSTLAGRLPEREPDADLAAPGPEAFRAAVETGRLPMGGPEMLYVLGKMQLAAFLADVDGPEVEAALRRARG